LPLCKRHHLLLSPGWRTTRGDAARRPVSHGRMTAELNTRMGTELRGRGRVAAGFRRRPRGRPYIPSSECLCDVVRSLTPL
jgi:hypothetical protein